MDDAELVAAEVARCRARSEELTAGQKFVQASMQHVRANLPEAVPTRVAADYLRTEMLEALGAPRTPTWLAYQGLLYEARLALGPVRMRLIGQPPAGVVVSLTAVADDD